EAHILGTRLPRDVDEVVLRLLRSSLVLVEPESSREHVPNKTCCGDGLADSRLDLDCSPETDSRFNRLAISLPDVSRRYLVAETHCEPTQRRKTGSHGEGRLLFFEVPSRPRKSPRISGRAVGKLEREFQK